MKNQGNAMLSVLLTGFGSIIIFKFPDIEWLGWIILLVAGFFLMMVEDR